MSQRDSTKILSERSRVLCGHGTGLQRRLCGAGGLTQVDAAVAPGDRPQTHPVSRRSMRPGVILIGSSLTQPPGHVFMNRQSR